MLRNIPHIKRHFLTLSYLKHQRWRPSSPDYRHQLFTVDTSRLYHYSQESS